MEGTMIWFHEERGEGFLLSDDGERLPVDRGAFVDGAAPVGRCGGLAVRFVVRELDGTRVATDVSVIDPDQPRRARRRSRGGAF